MPSKAPSGLVDGSLRDQPGAVADRPLAWHRPVAHVTGVYLALPSETAERGFGKEDRPTGCVVSPHAHARNVPLCGDDKDATSST
jgi:hypothetical protein